MIRVRKVSYNWKNLQLLFLFIGFKFSSTINVSKRLEGDPLLSESVNPSSPEIFAQVEMFQKSVWIMIDIEALCVPKEHRAFKVDLGTELFWKKN